MLASTLTMAAKAMAASKKRPAMAQMYCNPNSSSMIFLTTEVATCMCGPE